MRNIFGLLIALLFALPVHAQSTAQPVTPGYLTTSGCSGSQSPCFKPYTTLNPLPVTGSQPTDAQCAVSTATATACANFYQYVSPLWTGAVCNGGGDETAAFAAAETLAFTINSSAGLPIKYPNNKVCNFVQRWQVAHDGVTLFGWPQDTVYDGGSHESDSGYMLANTGFTTLFYAQGNCFIDLNGHHNLTFENINILGNGAQQGTVTFCDSTTYISGQLPTVFLRNVSVQLMGSVFGGPINTTAYTGSATGTCTGTLCGNLMTIRAWNSDLGENGWVSNGNSSDLFLYNSQVNSNACGAITGYSTTSADMLIIGNRIEATGVGLANTCPAGGAAVNVTGSGWNLSGNQFEIDFGADIAFQTGWAKFNMSGGHLFGGGSTNTAGARSAILFNAASGTPSYASFDGVAFMKNSTKPAYGVEFASGDTFSDYISITGGNMGSGVGYNTAQTIGTLPTHYFVYTLGENIQYAASTYLNWGSTTGSGGYGIRDNSGTIEVKNSGGSWAAPGGGVSVTAASNNIVINPTPGTGTFTVAATDVINAQGTAATYTIASSDLGETVTHAKATAVAVTLPQAGTGSFGAGAAYTEVNLGSGLVTVTPTTSTVNGAATLVLNQGQGAYLISDGTNYTAFVGLSPYGVISTGTKFTTSGGGCTVTATTGGATAGTFTTSTTGTCTTTITMGGASGITAPNGWFCTTEDLTSVPALFTGLMRQTSSTSTTAVFSGTTAASDVIAFSCIGY